MKQSNIVPFRPKGNKQVGPTPQFPDKVFTAVCSNPNCFWSRQVRISSSENTPENKEKTRQSMKTRHSKEACGCPGEVTLIQDTGIRRGGVIL